MDITRTIRISREKWLRGKGGYDSYLIRPRDGKQCCLGFYLKACGVAPGILKGKKTPKFLRRTDIPQEAQWLIAGESNSAATNFLTGCNDSWRRLPNTQEELIAKEFRKHGVKVIFTK